MNRHAEYRQLFEEVSTAIDYDLDTSDIMIGLSAPDLAGVASLANQADDNDALRLIGAAAYEQRIAEPTDVEEAQYKKVSMIILAMLYVRGDASAPEARATPVEALTLLRDNSQS